MIVERRLVDEAETIGFARCLSDCLRARALIFLEGQLGAGKTTFSRGILRGMGHQGAVKSPTFTIVEPYDLDEGQVYHFDLYRLNDPEELEYLGMDDYLETGNLCLIEWPERGTLFLPACDVQVTLKVEGECRRVFVEGKSAKGKLICREFVERLAREN